MASDCPIHPEKFRFPTADQADNALGRIWRLGRASVLPNRFYYCDPDRGGCAGYHHTKKPLRTKERTEL